MNVRMAFEKKKKDILWGRFCGVICEVDENKIRA
jgi:hypothetical protein